MHSQNILLFGILMNKEPDSCLRGLVIWQQLQSVDLNEYISIQDGIIVIIKK